MEFKTKTSVYSLTRDAEGVFELEKKALSEGVESKVQPGEIYKATHGISIIAHDHLIIAHDKGMMNTSSIEAEDLEAVKAFLTAQNN